MKQLLLLIISCGVLAGCVPNRQYESLRIERDYYRNKTVEADSLADLRALTTYEEIDNDDAERATMIRQVESLTATNKALNESYTSLAARYDDLLNQNQKLLTNTGEEVTGLQQSLADRTREISRREAEIRKLELDIQAREQAVTRLESDLAPAGGTVVKQRGATSFNPQQQFALRMNQVQNELNQQLSYLPANTYIISPAGVNRLQISLAEGLLTNDGIELSRQGLDLVRRMAATLRNYPTAEVAVVGHADGSETDATMAYEESTDKAINIAQQLIDAGVVAGNVTAGGKGFYAPVTDSSTAEGRAANRRLDIYFTLPQ